VGREEIGTSESTGDSDSSGGLVSVGESYDSGWNEESYDNVTNEIEIINQQAPPEPEPEPEPAPQPSYRTVVSACNIRSYPDYGDNVIGSLGGGESVLFYGEEAGWYKIEYNGVVGYIGPRFLQ
jgi:uncharacterized protein YgiM (DUF1202 family)